MKRNQIITGTFLNVLLYLGGSFLASSFNSNEWVAEGKFFFVMLTFAIWIFPLALNYLNGDNKS